MQKSFEKTLINIFTNTGPNPQTDKKEPFKHFETYLEKME